MKSGEKRPVGNLLKYKNISKEDIDLYLMLMFNNKYRFLSPLRDIVDDDKKFLEILDLFAGNRIWFPERDKTYRYLERASIYNYLKNRGFTKKAYKDAANIINRRIIQTQSLMATIDKVLEKKEKNIKSLIRGVNKELGLNRNYMDTIDNYVFDFAEGEDRNDRLGWK